jgi:electron transport complex protein RnfB
LDDLTAHTKGTGNAPEVDRKRAIIEAALAKARAKQHPG